MSTLQPWVSPSSPNPAEIQDLMMRGLRPHYADAPFFLDYRVNQSGTLYFAKRHETPAVLGRELTVFAQGFMAGNTSGERMSS